MSPVLSVLAEPAARRQSVMPPPWWTPSGSTGPSLHCSLQGIFPRERTSLIPSGTSVGGRFCSIVCGILCGSDPQGCFPPSGFGHLQGGRLWWIVPWRSAGYCFADVCLGGAFIQVYYASSGTVLQGSLLVSHRPCGTLRSLPQGGRRHCPLQRSVSDGSCGGQVQRCLGAHERFVGKVCSKHLRTFSERLVGGHQNLLPRALRQGRGELGLKLPLLG